MTTDTLPLAELELSAGDLPAPGSWRSALYRPDAPGAALDGQPWARSWGAFMHAITDPDNPAARTLIGNVMSERVPSEGGFLVPEFLRSQVLAYMTAPIVRPQAMVLPMTSDRLAIPVLDNPSQASSAQALGGMTFAWVEPGAVIPGSAATALAPQFGRAVLEARKAAAYMQGVPNELVDDAAGAFGDFTARVIAKGYAWFEDDAWLNGTGVGQPQGLINAACAVGVDRTTANAVTFLDVVAMFKALHPASKQSGLTPGVTSTAWLMSATVMDQILEIYYNPTGSEVVPPSGWFSMGDGREIGPNMLGLPAVVTDHQPAIGATGDIVLADLAEYVIGDRLAMTVERSAKGAGFVTGTSNFRIKSRVDGRYWIQSPTTTEAGQTVSPVVVLDTHT
jgi:HK97 family phage major capsid protein